MIYNNLLLPNPLRSRVSMRYCMYTLNSKGDITLPCLTPLEIGNLSDLSLFQRTCIH